MEPIVTFMIILFSLIIIPTAICSALGRKEREQEAAQVNRTTSDTSSQSKHIASNNDYSIPQSKDDLNDIPFSRLKEYVDATLTFFSDLDSPGYLECDTIQYSASIDILHLILHLSASGGGVTKAVSEFIKNLLGYNRTPVYWNEYIELNDLNNSSFCNSIPMTLRVLYSMEMFVPNLEKRTDTICHFFVTSLLLSGKKYLNMCGGGNLKQVCDYVTLCYGIEYYLAEGEVKGEIETKNESLQKSINQTINDYNSYANDYFDDYDFFDDYSYSHNHKSSYQPKSYYLCPNCNMVFNESAMYFHSCGETPQTASLKLEKITPKHEETFYAISGRGANIKLLYASGINGRWLTSTNSSETPLLQESYRNSFFSNTMDEYHLSHPIFSNVYYRAGHFLYSRYKLCSGVVPFTDKFSLECRIIDPLTRYYVTDRFVFQLDGTVTFYKDEVLFHKGNYIRKGNVIMVDMIDVNTNEKYKYYLGIYRNQLCLETYVDYDGYCKYIRFAF